MISKLLIFTTFVLLSSCQDLITCETAKCNEQKMCCIPQSGADAICSSDLLKCPFKPVQDFSILWQILIIVAAFSIGIPLLITLTNLLFCTQFLCGKSICEILAYNVFCLVMLSPKQLLRRMKALAKLKNNEEDEEEQELSRV